SYVRHTAPTRTYTLSLHDALPIWPLMTTTTEQPTTRTGATNEPVELGRYTLAAGERVVQGQRVLGVVRLIDIPATGDGRPWTTRSEEHTSELQSQSNLVCRLLLEK